jgi:plastocyanin
VSLFGCIRGCSPAIAAALLVLLLAACGGTPAASVAPAPSGAVAVEATEYRFAPATLSVAAGNVVFWVRNAGTVDHEFELLKGDEVVAKMEAIDPGTAKDVPVTLAVGEYTFMCKLSGHDQLGMKGTLTVTGG